MPSHHVLAFLAPPFEIPRWIRQDHGEALPRRDERMKVLNLAALRGTSIMGGASLRYLDLPDDALFGTTLNLLATVLHHLFELVRWDRVHLLRLGRQLFIDAGLGESGSSVRRCRAGTI